MTIGLRLQEATDKIKRLDKRRELNRVGEIQKFRGQKDPTSDFQLLNLDFSSLNMVYELMDSQTVYLVVKRTTKRDA